MQTNLPKEFWVDREALIRPQICSHISKRNEFEPGVRCYEADSCDDDYAWVIFWSFCFGILWTLAILWFGGFFNAHL